jgi:hypothetical protein
MPSYRVTVDIREVLPGVAPEDVLPTAERVLAGTHRVEDRRLDVVSTSAGLQPRLQLRFLVPATGAAAEDAEAEAAARALVDDLGEVARCGRWELRRGPGRHWRLRASGGCVSEL